MKRFIMILTVIIIISISGAEESKEDIMTFKPVSLDRVAIQGEIGRRIDITIHNNLAKASCKIISLLVCEVHNEKA